MVTTKLSFIRTVIYTMTHDYYETLQVHPKADRAGIDAAYARLRNRYDPARLDGAAAELVALARRKRDDIERAYAVLSDPSARAAYDAEQVAAPPEPPRPAADDQIDNRARPPARDLDGPQEQISAPSRQNGRRSVRALTALVWLAGLAALLAAVGLALAGRGRPAETSVALTPIVDGPSALDQFEARIPEARLAAEQNPNDPRAWIDYGDLLYDSVQIMREQAADSPLYQRRLPRWREAAEAYRRALELTPDNAAVRADMGASACFYGAGNGNQQSVRDGLEQARQAAQAATDDPRVLLNLASCLTSGQPPQIEEAMQLWRDIIQIGPADSPLAIEAQQLIARYGVR